MTARCLYDPDYFKHNHGYATRPKTSCTTKEISSPCLTPPFEHVSDDHFGITNIPVIFKCPSTIDHVEEEGTRVRKHMERTHYRDDISLVLKHMAGRNSIEKNSSIG